MVRNNIILFFVIMTFLLSCAQKNHKGTNKVVLIGSVTSPNQNTIYLSNEPILLENEWSTASDTTGVSTTVDTDGNFRFEAEIEKPDFYRINYGDKSVQLYLSPKDSILVTLDSIITIEGSNAHLNKYIQKQEIELGKAEGHILSNIASFYSLDERVFTKQLDSLKNSNVEQYNSFVNQIENVPSDFKERSISTINNLYSYYQLLYPLGYESITRNKADLTENYFEKLSKGLDMSEFLNDKRYTTYLDKYIEIMSAGEYKYERYDNKPLEKIHARYNVIKELSLNQSIKDYLFEQHFKLCNENYSTKHWKSIFDDFKENNQNEALYSKIAKTYSDSYNDRAEPDIIKTYKTVSGIELEAHVFFPKGHSKELKKSAYLYFHGGGWSLGMVEAGYASCKRMAEKGMVAISFEYRLIDVHGNIIQKGLEDAKSAIRWTRSQATELGVNPNKVVAAGFSAGSHLAASTAIIDDFVSEDNNSFSSKPNLVITQSASYDLTKADYFSGISRGQSESVSLLQNIQADLPPFLSFHTTEDYLAPVNRFYEFKAAMESYKNDFQFQVFDGVGHFFRDKETREKMNDLIDNFLEARGFLTNTKD